MCKFRLTVDDDLNKNDIKHRKIYESENYKLRIFNKENGFNDIALFTQSKNKYIPCLYLRMTDDYEYVSHIDIEVTGYGALEVDEIKKMMNAFNIALESIEEIEKILEENNLLAI